VKRNIVEQGRDAIGLGEVFCGNVVHA
jgi:hypothetical protein